MKARFRAIFCLLMLTSTPAGAQRALQSPTEFFGFEMGADRKLAVRAREQLRLQPCLVGAECRDDRVVRLLELGLQRAILDAREGIHHGRAEELLVAVELLDRDLRVDAGHVGEVATRRGERLGHRALAGHEAPQARGGGRVVALD
jgi:hypothetical protein